jgi:CRP-like cAMP-binding protein
MSLLIAEVPLFRNLSGEDITIVMAQTEEKSYRQGQTVFAEDDEADGLYVVMSGSFTVFVVSRASGMMRKPLATLKLGMHVGELALIDGQPRSAGVECTADGELLFLPAKAFLKLLEERPNITELVTKNLCNMISNHKAVSYSSEELKQRIRDGRIPPTSANLKALCKLLRTSNYSYERA